MQFFIFPFYTLTRNLAG